jgi:TonB family protein
VLISLKPKNLLIPPPPQPVDIGDIKGIGDADFDSPGDIPLSARQADETQAWYTVHKSGVRSANSSNASDDPLRGQNGRGGPRSPAAQALADAIRQIENPAPVRTPRPQLKPRQNPAKPRPATPASPPALSLALSSAARVMIPSTTQPSPHVEIAAAPVPLAPQLATPPTPPTPPTDTPPPAASGDGLRPGSAPSSGDPAPHSDTDSDPFSVAGGVVFHNGKTAKRFGRKARLTDPHLSIAGDWDAFAMGTPRVVLKISIDATGNVTDAEILKSSGQPDDIDLPTQLAAQHWWFEPRKDAKGHPVPDTFPFPVEYR